LLREALGLSVDRGSIHSVLLQGAGQPAGSALPTWISGFGFVFSVQADLQKARKLRDQVHTARAWTVGYDGSDPLARLMVDRIALNARDAGLSLVPTAVGASDLRLMRMPLASDPWIALVGIAAQASLPEPKKSGATVDELFAAEGAALANQRVIPLFHLPMFLVARAWGTGQSSRRKHRFSEHMAGGCEMSFRRKLLVVFSLTVFLSVAGVALLVQLVTRNAFEKTENQRTAALVAQFQREFNRRGDDVARRVEAIAASDAVTRMATALNGTSADFAEYFDLARAMAEVTSWVLEILDGRGTIVFCAMAAEVWISEPAFEVISTSNDQSPFLSWRLPNSTALSFLRHARSVWGAFRLRCGRPETRQELPAGTRSAGGHARPPVSESWRSFFSRSTVGSRCQSECCGPCSPRGEVCSVD
jgi:hypothetical protein